MKNVQSSKVNVQVGTRIFNHLDAQSNGQSQIFYHNGHSTYLWVALAFVLWSIAHFSAIFGRCAESSLHHNWAHY